MTTLSFRYISYPSKGGTLKSKHPTERQPAYLRYDMIVRVLLTLSANTGSNKNVAVPTLKCHTDVLEGSCKTEAMAWTEEQ